LLQERSYGTGFGFDGVEEVASVNKHIGFLLDDLIYSLEEVVIDLFFPEVNPAFGIERLNAAKPKWVSAMWMRCIVVDFYLGGAGI
jgi:hypothetical protein